MKNPDEIFSNLDVSVYHNSALEYPDEPPYSPHIRYPEYFFDNTIQKENGVYGALRNALFLLDMDKDNFNTAHWNPFREIIKPRDKVVVKPNFALSNHREGGDLFSIITHPSIIRAVVDYIYIALRGKGKIIIADAPVMDCSFRQLLKETKLESIKELYRNEAGFNIEIYDLRQFWLDTEDNHAAAYTKYRHKLPGDPLDSVLVNLGKHSLFYRVNNYKKFYGADYNREEVIKHHHDDIQKYSISKTILSADVVISIPKLKINKKTAVTLNIKGLVGINTNKNYLVHYTLGTPSDGGDQFPDNILTAKESMKVNLQRWACDWLLSKRNATTDFLYNTALRLGKIFLRPLGFKLDKEKSHLDCGSWYGNDTLWRMVIDLLRIFIYVDKEGSLQSAPTRRIFSIVDGVIGGEAEGPLTPDSKRCGVLIAGFNPCAVDLVCTRLMGLDYRKIPKFTYILDHPELFRTNLSKIRIFSNNGDFEDLFYTGNKKKYFDFIPSLGWKGFVECDE